MNEAFEKILERLEEYRCNDLIEHNSELSPHCKRIDCDTTMDCNLCVMDKAISIVQEVAEEYNGGWIACSERLPEESGYYLVTYHDWSDGNFLPKYDDTYVRRLHYQISEHFVGWNYPKNVDDRAENDCHKEVIAWQPLPEPYKERD